MGGRRKPALCGVPTRKGAPCNRPAGWGTDHPGKGGCRQHPTSPTPKKARARKAPRRRPAGRHAVLDWTEVFLAAFEETHLVTESAKRAGIHRDTAYDRRAKDPEFGRRWSDAEERSTELLEREAYRRAAVGTEKPVYYKGKRIDLVREYSDVLLIFLLKARRPQTYRERVEHTGAGGGPLEHRVALDLSKLTDEQLSVLEAIQPDGNAPSTDEG